jgi:hypothetical protein
VQDLLKNNICIDTELRIRSHPWMKRNPGFEDRRHRQSVHNINGYSYLMMVWWELKLTGDSRAHPRSANPTPNSFPAEQYFTPIHTRIDVVAVK